jgi:peptide/nickel transport system permease protein
VRQIGVVFGVLRSSPKASIGLGILIVMVLLGALHDPILVLMGFGNTGDSASRFAPRPSPPAWLAFIGPGALSEFAAIVTGLWNSLRIGFEAGIISTLIGVAVAFYSAYRGGFLDSVLSTTTDLFLVIPAFPLLAVFAAYQNGTTINAIAVVLSAFGWAVAARPIRSHVLSLRTRSFVDLARATKEGTTEIIFTELVPNMLPYIAMGLSQAIMVAILAVIGLDVFGLGPVGRTDLGSLVYGAVTGGAMTLGDWQAVFVPVATVVLLFLSLGLITLGLEERFNPRLQTMVGQ